MGTQFPLVEEFIQIPPSEFRQYSKRQLESTLQAIFNVIANQSTGSTRCKGLRKHLGLVLSSASSRLEGMDFPPRMEELFEEQSK